MMIKQVSVEDILPLRQKVLRPGKSLDQSRFKADDENETFHLALFIDREICAIASFMAERSKHFNSKHQHRLRGMAVAEKHRKQKYGQALFLKGHQVLISKKSSLLWFNARREAVAFYKKQGCSVLGKEFIIPDVGPHFFMYKIIKKEEDHYA